MGQLHLTFCTHISDAYVKYCGAIRIIYEFWIDNSRKNVMSDIIYTAEETYSLETIGNYAKPRLTLRSDPERNRLF